MARIIEPDKFHRYKKGSSEISVNHHKRIIRVSDKTTLAGFEEYLKNSGYTVEDI